VVASFLYTDYDLGFSTPGLRVIGTAIEQHAWHRIPYFEMQQSWKAVHLACSSLYSTSANATRRARTELTASKGNILDDEAEKVFVSLPEGLVEFVPAVVLLALTGAEALAARFAKMTFNALSCCPNPVFPSDFAVVHCDPHAIPLLPSEHEAAAPEADFCRVGVIVLAVNGAICRVTPIHCAARPLKLYSSFVHVRWLSHATSMRMPGALVALELELLDSKTDMAERRL